MIGVPLVMVGIALFFVSMWCCKHNKMPTTAVSRSSDIDAISIEARSPGDVESGAPPSLQKGGSSHEEVLGNAILGAMKDGEELKLHRVTLGEEPVTPKSPLMSALEKQRSDEVIQ